MHTYECFVTANCFKSGEGKWAVLSCPDYAKWTVSLSGKTSCTDATKLYLLGVLAALDDLTTRCNVLLKVDSTIALGVLEELSAGLFPETPHNSLHYALLKQFDRHNLTLDYAPHVSDKRWKTVLMTLRET